MVTPPDICSLSGAQIYVPGQATNTFLGTDSWQLGGLIFTATNNNTSVVLSPLGQAQLVNGSFELGLGGWTVVSPTVELTPYLPFGVVASHGTNYVSLGIHDVSGAVLEQAFPIVGGYDYTLEFDHMAIGDPGRTGIVRVEVDSPMGILATQTYTNAARNTPPYPYQSKAIPFSVPAGVTSATVRFTDLSPSAGVAVDPVLDNVRISGRPSWRAGG
jgi:hypothetical protein